MTVQLPIDPYINDIVHSSSRNQIISASPGSGKTTRIPPALLPTTEKCILCVEPRRLACIAAASRVARERGERLGDVVGYHVRGDKKCTQQTKLCFVTTGMLLQYLCRDPFLESVGCIIFDEFHERAIETDLSLAMARCLQRNVRDDLRLIVMSATLAHQEVAAYVGNSETFVIDAPIYPLEIRYVARMYGYRFADYADALMEAIQAAVAHQPGDCLVFLPGLGDIQAAIARASLIFGDTFELLACHASLQLDAQKAILETSPLRRRIIFSTNVAESSLTIPGVCSVVDVGLVKRKFFDSVSGLSRLETVRISQASADQRAGRAARLAPGLCIRLWNESAHHGMESQALPEIERLDLSQAYLQLSAWGLESPESIEFISQPSAGRLNDARALLEQLGALHAHALTELGKQMVRLPVEPRLARWLLAGRTFHCVEDVALMAAYLSEAPYRRAQRDEWPGPDLYLDFLKLKKKIRTPAMSQLKKIADDIAADARALGHLPRTENEKMDEREALCRSMLCAYPDRLAQPRARNGEKEKLSASDPRRLIKPIEACMSGNRGVVVKEAQTLKDAAFFICADLDLVRGVQRAANTVWKAIEIDARWIPWQQEIVARYEPDKDRVVVADALRFDIFTLRETFLHDDAHQNLARQTLLDAALQNPQKVLNFSSPAWIQFHARVQFAKKMNPSLDVPSFDMEWGKSLLPDMVRRADCFRALFAMDLTPFAIQSLDFNTQREIQTLAPERIKLQNGFETAVDYTGNPPIVRVKIQKAFGTHVLPKVGGGKVPVIMHFCAPNGQPAQMTQDIENFWLHTYADVRKLLRGRYPKHDWPEHPPM